MKNLTRQEALTKLQELQDYINNLPKQYTIEDITSLEAAEEILKNCKEHIQCFENHFPLEKYWKQYQLDTIQNAINYIDNNNQWWTPDWNNINETKYCPHFGYRNSSWLFIGTYSHLCNCSGSGSFALKTKKGVQHFGNTFLNLLF